MQIIVIGKANDCDIIVNNNTVSRHHAQLAIFDSHIEVIDLGSTNGTYVNGERIGSPRKLITGDLLVLGGELFDWQIYLSLMEAEDKEVRVEVETPIQTKKKNSSTLIIVSLSLLVFSGIAYLIYKTYLSNTETEMVNEMMDPIIEPGSVEYDFSCLEEEDDHGVTEIINVLSDVEADITDAVGEEVTVAEEMEYGRDILKDMPTSNTGSSYLKIREILHKLVSALGGKSEYRYEIHLIKEDVINAFTCGGQIFMYQGMIDFCRDDNELAGIIAHEIAHNELGHIKREISQMKTLDVLIGGEMGEITTSTYMSATVSFGQKHETHCDLYGMDLAFKAKYDACKIVDIWKRMDDHEYNIGESMINSHPYSHQRASCCQNHINKYYPNSCK